MNKLKIGWAEKSIIPERPVSLSGQFHKRISKYVESPLTVTALAIESGDDQLVLCSCDLVCITANLVKIVRSKIKNKLSDLNGEKIIISATHTHTGPEYVTGEPFEENFSLLIAQKFISEDRHVLVEEDPPEVMNASECEEFIANGATDAICEAWLNRSGGFISPQFGRAVIGHCRRVTYNDRSALMYGNTNNAEFEALEGGNDSGVELLYIFDVNKKLTGVVINVACPSQIVEGEYYVSSDFWGKAKLSLREAYGDNLFVLGLCSTAGDQSPRDLIRRGNNVEPSMYAIEGTLEIGKRIKNIVSLQLPAAEKELYDQAVLIHKVKTVDFPIRKVTRGEYNSAKEKLEAYVASCPRQHLDYGDMANLHTFGGTMERFHYQQNHFFYKAEIHAVRLGNIAFATNPIECFLDYGLKIKARSKADQTFLIQLACDSGGYLPTEKAEKGSHYSAYVSSGKTGHEGGEVLVANSLDMINSLFE